MKKRPLSAELSSRDHDLSYISAAFHKFRLPLFSLTLLHPRLDAIYDLPVELRPR